MTLELSGKEIEILLMLVDRRVNELGPEIHHTDSRPYRHVLEAQRQTLQFLQKELTALAAPAL